MISLRSRLAESNLSSAQISEIKGTGRNRMLTKGDVLAALGKISDAKGSMKGIPKTAYGTKAGYGDVSGKGFLQTIFPFTNDCFPDAEWNEHWSRSWTGNVGTQAYRTDDCYSTSSFHLGRFGEGFSPQTTHVCR
jgi:hypothetical protein